MNFMKRLLKDLAEISLGYSLRTSVEKFQDNQGNVLLLQAGDLSGSNLYINESDSLARVALDGVKSASILLPGDVLFAYRRSAQGSLKTSVFNVHSDTPIIASSTLYVIRLRTTEILPEYLAVYFSSTTGQKNLQALATGAAVKAVAIKDLKDLSIPIPNKETQITLVDLWRNIQNQNSILGKRIELQEKLVNDFLSTVTQSR